MTETETIKKRAACLLIASDKATMPVFLNESNTFVQDVFNQVTEREKRDALYDAWKLLLEEEIDKLVKAYSVLAGEE